MLNEIKYLYPTADPLVDFELRDNSDGKGQFIARWDTAKLGAQPTAQQLADVSVAAARSAKLAHLEQSRKKAVNTLPPVTVDSKQYPATQDYREVITGIARRQAAAKPVPASLRGVDGVAVAITPTDRTD
jgi:hypothetical protein